MDDDLGPVRPPNLQIDEIQASDRPERSTSSRPSAPRSYSDRSGSRGSGPYRSSAPRPASDRSGSDRSSPERPRADRPSGGRSSSSRPFSSEGGLPRAYTTSSGKPRAGGARPSSKPGGKPGGRSYGSGSGARSGGSGSYGSGPGARSGGSSSQSIDPRTGSGYRPQPGGARRSFDGPSGGPAKRPYTPRTEGASDYRPTQSKPYPNSTPRAERKAGPAWKSKPSFGGGAKPASGSHSKPGGFSKSGYKSKPGGAGGKRTGGPRPGGKRPGGASGGKRRG